MCHMACYCRVADLRSHNPQVRRSSRLPGSCYKPCRKRDLAYPSGSGWCGPRTPRKPVVYRIGDWTVPTFSRSRTPSYRHHKPSEQAVVTLGGRDVYLGRFGSPESQADYDRLIAEWLSNGRRLPGPASESGADLTVNEMLLAYLRHADSYDTKGGRPTSAPKNIRLALRPLRQGSARGAPVTDPPRGGYHLSPGRRRSDRQIRRTDRVPPLAIHRRLARVRLRRPTPAMTDDAPLPAQRAEALRRHGHGAGTSPRGRRAGRGGSGPRPPGGACGGIRLLPVFWSTSNGSTSQRL
jgi:hypothetical protein